MRFAPALVLAVLSLAVGATPANADDAGAATGAISGSVTNHLDEALTGVCVSAQGPDFEGTQTDGQGRYTIEGLEEGEYRVFFGTGEGCGGERYVDEYYNGKLDWDSADLVAVLSGQTTEDINAALREGGAISGQVTDEDGEPIAGICVFAEGIGFPGGGGAGTDGDGNYTIAALPEGDYRLVFQSTEWCDGGDYVSEYYDGKPDWDSADPVGVTSGVTITANASLREAGIIAGQVVDDHGEPIEGVCVSANPESDGLGGFAQTDELGEYTIRGLAPGSYRVFFESSLWCDGGEYVSEFYQDALDWESADLVEVIGGATFSASASLGEGGKVAGTVTNDDGDPIEGICVEAYPASAGSHGYGFAETDSSGEYTIKGLVEGSYWISFRSAEWCDGGGYVSRQLEEPVEVVGGETTAGVDAVLLRAGTITGQVTNEAEEGIAGVCVLAERTQYEGDGWAHTDEEGNYTVRGLPPDDYKLRFQAGTWCGGGDYAPQYFDDKPDFDSADVVEVTAGQTATVSPTLREGGKIAGNVTDEDGSPLEGICVNAESSWGDGWTQTDANGDYLITGLGGGAHRVAFASSSFCGGGGYRFQYYDGKSDFESADLVEVTAGETTGDIDAQMVARGPNTAPVCEDQQEIVESGSSVVLVADCSDADDDWLTYSIVDGPSHGTYTFVTANSVRYEPNADFIGEDTITYRAFDETEYSNTATVTIDVVEPVPPDTSIMSGPSGTTPSTSATFAFTSTKPGSWFECDLDEAGWHDCSSPVTYTDLGPGQHTFAVRATDAGGRTDETPATRTWTIDAQSTTHTTSGEVSSGGTMSTDPGGEGPSVDAPVTTAVTSPVAGEVTIVQSSEVTEPPPTGYSLLGYEIVIEAPEASPEDPLQLVFTLDSSLVPAGTDLEAVTVFRNGVAVPACTGAPGVADPDPCVAEREQLGDGDIRLTILTSRASTWNFGLESRAAYDFSGFFAPVENRPTVNLAKAGSAIPVKFSLGGDQGLDVFATGYPAAVEIPCDSEADLDGIESTVNAGASGLSYDTDSDRYTYVWKTKKGWTGCRQLVLRFNDAAETTRRASFLFRAK